MFAAIIQDHGCAREESLRSPHRLAAGYRDCKNFRER
jgi:hypothetical protein